jgi:hypothetical protein
VRSLREISPSAPIIIVQGDYIANVSSPMDPEKKFKFAERCIAVACGVMFVAVLLALAVLIPTPTLDQRQTFRIVLAIAAAGFVSMTPGFLEITVSKWIRAGGALAVFAIVFFYNPGSLVTP